MKMTPVRFVGHKIGPFDHIELNWEKESRYTLIVAENGMGKTTLVAAMAACLAAGNGVLFPDNLFARLAHDDTSYAYLEVDINGKKSGIVRWATRIPKVEPDFDLHRLSKTVEDSPFAQDSPTKRLTHVHSPFGDPPPWMITLRDYHEMSGTWSDGQNVKGLAAAYGVNRDLTHAKISGYQEIKTNPSEEILNPFANIRSHDIFQWIANQHVNSALAFYENQNEEAEAYLLAIRRVEQFFESFLDIPVTFKVKRNPFQIDLQQNGTALTVDQLSDGTRSLMSWPLDYLMRASRVNWADPADSARAPGLILVDEIDAHLHPEWQRRVMSMVNQLLPETYIIATTHSPFVLGATDDAQVFRIYKDEDGTLQVESSFDELYGYPADLILQKQFVPSLYPIETERKLERLSELARQVAAKTISASEKKEHDRLLRELSKVNPWLNNLLALSQIGGSTL
ncbi:MAG: AAA family ATPase [Ardenticatenaceae bacterium]